MRRVASQDEAAFAPLYRPRGCNSWIAKDARKDQREDRAVYFTETGFASVVAVQRNGKQVEVDLIGREGMTGLPIVLGNHRSPHSTYI